MHKSPAHGILFTTRADALHSPCRMEEFIVNRSRLPLTLMCLLITVSTYAATPEADRYSRRCQGYATHNRSLPASAALLWGTRRSWDDSQQRTDERRSVLVSVDIASPRIADAEVKSLRLEKGRLVASPRASTSLVGSVLQGTSSDGKPVEVALCGAEPVPADPDMAWYRIEVWNPVAQAWESPCVATGRVPDPRTLAVDGVWDSSGAHQQVPGKLTLACESSAIAECIRWGYKPWAQLRGQSLADLHQACTRMVRADYCGNGRSHTQQDITIDIYDNLGVISPAAGALAKWAPAHASFEAAWAPDGATCLSHTRDGRALETILRECPGRFRPGVSLDLGHGDTCTVQRVDIGPRPALLRNRSLGSPSATRSDLGP